MQTLLVCRRPGAVGVCWGGSESWCWGHPGESLEHHGHGVRHRRRPHHVGAGMNPPWSTASPIHSVLLANTQTQGMASAIEDALTTLEQA